MSFKKNILKARSHLVFIAGIGAAFTLIIYLDALGAAAPLQARASVFNLPSSPNAAPAPFPGELTAEEKRAAEIAWTYFERNLQPETGLVNSADGYPSTTMWDQASYLLALISAYRLDLITEDVFDARASQALASLADAPLFEETLPNKAYNSITLEMTDYNNEPSERGVGWSALDVARIMTPINIIAWNYPQHAPAARAVVNNWRIEAMLENGLLIGARVAPSGETERVQEGRIGYEEYAAGAMALLGYDAKRAAQYEDFLEFVDIYEIGVPTDTRDFLRFGAHNYVVSEPYILAGLEFGWTSDMQEMAYRVYAAQAARYEKTGQLTAVSEDNVDRPPYFVYNTVFSNGKAWNAIAEDGADASELRSISTKAAFGWDALYNNAYTDALVEKVMPLHDVDVGFYSGWYEELDEPNTAATANANGIILQSLHYKVHGRLVALYGE